MNNFELARRFYKDEERKILACKRNEWAFAPYAWNAFVNMTPIELAIWEKIRNVNAVFYPQYPVLRYFADFANPVAKIAIECDGAAFHHDKEKDAKRDAEFESIGWIVHTFRFLSSKTSNFLLKIPMISCVTRVASNNISISVILFFSM